MMNKKFDGAAAPKHYESPSLAVLNVNLEMGFAQSGNQVKDMPNWAEWEDEQTY
ncbi:MAG: hypothetical protein SPH63_04220 [Candidatus Cryptobacteroides sp.]|nr:hypothetical protein [Bacteroides sp.]MDY5302209.1 hypothetical protein [Candidatus Cryptobacteroides sp.]